MISFPQVEFAKAIAPEYISYIGPYYVNKIHVMCSLINAPICTISLPFHFSLRSHGFYLLGLKRRDRLFT